MVRGEGRGVSGEGLVDSPQRPFVIGHWSLVIPSPPSPLPLSAVSLYNGLLVGVRLPLGICPLSVNAIYEYLKGVGRGWRSALWSKIPET